MLVKSVLYVFYRVIATIGQSTFVKSGLLCLGQYLANILHFHSHHTPSLEYLY